MRPIHKAFISATALGALLTGCAVGPERPPLHTASGGFVSSTEAQAIGQAPRDDWWRLYPSSELDQLVQKALDANTDLRVAAANLERARTVVTETTGALYAPTTQFSASATQGRSATANAFAALRGTTASVSANDSASFAASYELDLFGRLRRAAAAAGADASAAKASLDYARVVVVSDTVRAYVDACSYSASLAAARRSQAIAHQTVEITRDKARLGAASAVDLDRAEALSLQADAAVPSLEAQKQSSLFSLAVLTGQTPETNLSGLVTCTSAPQLAGPIAIGDAASLIRRRPDVRGAERALQADTARVGVAMANLFPTISLGGQIGASGATPDKAVTYAGTSFSLGPVVSWTVPNIITSRARLAGSRATAKASLARLDGVVLNALKDMETALTGLNAETSRNRALHLARDQLSEAEKLMELRYQSGAASFLELLDAQRSLQSAESDLASSDLKRAESEVALFRALGGGWQSALPPKN